MKNSNRAQGAISIKRKPANYVQLAVAQFLESRFLLSVQGEVFLDASDIGTLNTPSQTGLSGRTVFADLNDNGVLDAGEPSTVTDANGLYTLPSPTVAAPILTVSPPGWTTSGNSSPVALPGSTITGANIGQYPVMNVTGKIYADNNANGVQDAGELGLAGVTVYQDLNHDYEHEAGEPSTVTASDGTYTLYGVVPPSASSSVQIVPVALQGYRAESLAIFFNYQQNYTQQFTVAFANQSYVFGSVDLSKGNVIGGFAGQTVYADVNNDGILDSGDVTGVTNSNGNFQFGGLPSGTYPMRMVVPTGYTIQSGTSASTSISVGTLTNSYAAFTLIQSAQATGTISGTVFTDNNQNGLFDSGDTDVSGAEVYLDNNGDGVFDTGDTLTTTATDGSYQFSGLVPGTYSVRDILPAGSYQTVPATSSYTQTVAAGQAVTGLTFGQAVNRTVTGVVFNDLGGTGPSTPVFGDNGIAGVTVFDDLNGNGVLDAGEPSTLTSATGLYTLANLGAGSASIRVIRPANYYSTDAGNGQITATVPEAGVDFPLYKGMTIQGIVYSDSNPNGVRDWNEPGLAGVRVFVDANFDGVYQTSELSTFTDANGLFTLSDLAPGTAAEYQSIPVKVVVPSGYRSETSSEQFSNFSGADYTSSFALSSSAYVYGGVLVTINGQTNWLAGITVYADLNNDGVLDAGDPSTVTAGNGQYQFGVPVGTDTLSVVLPSGYTMNSGSASLSVPVGALSPSYHIFGLATTTPPLGVIGGTVFQDTNQNGTFDLNELPSPNQTVYIDSNGDGVLDDGEIAATTDSAGRYQFNGITAGSYTVRQVLPTGYVQTQPTSNSGVSVTLSNSSSGVGTGYATFGIAPAPASISGTVFYDANGNATQDSGESALGNPQVYIDANGDGIYDAGDTLAVSNASGFTFSNLSAGTYVVRQILAPGYLQTSPAAGTGISVTLTAGQSSSISFGTDNPKPVANIAGPYNVSEGSSVVLSSTGSSEIGGQIVKYEWDLNYDGVTFNTDATGSSTTFSAAGLDGPSLITIALRVTDSLGNTNIAIQSLTITNAPPTATFSGSSVILGSPATVTFTGATDPSNADIAAGFTYSYDFNDDGTYDLVTTSPTATVPATYLTTLGTHTIAGEITDKDGGSTIYTATVQVNPAAAAITKLTGTIIGTTGSYQNDGNTIAKAFDGNLATYYDGASANGNWLGLDLGSGYTITSVAYVSRSGSGLPARMNGGIFQASNTANFSSGVVNLYTIATNANPSSTAFTTQAISNTGVFRYVRYLSPNGSYGDVAELQFYGTPATVVTPTTGTVSGTLTGPASATVYLDANNNGILDSGELSTTATGSYSFSSVPVGSYVVRQVVPSGYTQTTPASGYSISVTAGSSFTGENFVDTANTTNPTGPAKLTGTVIGTSGSYQNAGNTIAKALDGSLTSYFDGPTANGNWVGLDLGSTYVITSVSYASRSGLASRMNGGIFQGSNSATFASGVVNLYTIGSSANPSSTALTTQTISNTTAFRYVRYLSPNGSYGDVAEVQFFGTASGGTVTPPPTLTQFTGTTIGTAGSYQNDGTTIAKATDGSLATFYDGASANGNWVGLDLGSAQIVKQISFAPRSSPNLASRMVGGIFQASNTADFSSGVVNLYTVTTAPAVNVLTSVTVNVTTAYRYYRYLSPNGSYGDVAEIAFYG